VDHLIAWLDNPAVKYVLIIVGGWLLKRWPQFINGAIPIVTGVAALLVSILRLMFPETQQAVEAVGSLIGPAVAHADTVLRVVSDQTTPHLPWWQSLFFNAILPWLIAIGTHSAGKNTGQWLLSGGGLLRAK